MEAKPCIDVYTQGGAQANGGPRMLGQGQKMEVSATSLEQADEILGGLSVSCETVEERLK